MRTLRVVTLSAVAMLVLASAYGQQQQQARKSYSFRGKVTEVDPSSKRLTIDGERVEGWMEAMTMAYAVDKDDVFSRVKAGDRITATVYEGDLTLHDVRIDPPAASAAPPAPPRQAVMRLADLERMALENNPTLKQAAAQIDAAAGRAKQAGLYPNPTIIAV